MRRHHHKLLSGSSGDTIKLNVKTHKRTSMLGTAGLSRPGTANPRGKHMQPSKTKRLVFSFGFDPESANIPAYAGI
jgi:hypothetical protein